MLQLGPWVCRNKDGHKAWRKFRGYLERTGHIEVMSATVGADTKPRPGALQSNGMPIRTLVKLLKPWTPAKAAGRQQVNTDEIGVSFTFEVAPDALLAP